MIVYVISMLLLSIFYLFSFVAIKEEHQLLETFKSNKLLYSSTFVFPYVEFGFYICSQLYYYALNVYLKKSLIMQLRENFFWSCT